MGGGGIISLRDWAPASYLFNSSNSPYLYIRRYPLIDSGDRFHSFFNEGGDMKESVSLLMRRSHTSHQRLGSVSPTDQVRSGQVSGHLNHSSLFTLCCLLFTLTLFTSSYCLPYLVQHRTDWMEGLSLTVGFKHC